MWLVNAALRHPYSVYVAMLLVGILGCVAIGVFGFAGYQGTPTDILPTLKVPVVVVYASYRGMPAPDMEQSITSVLERSLTRCDHLEHIESRSLLGAGIIHLFFRPQVDADVATSQVIALVQTEMQNMPPGLLQPTVLKYDASAIPVGNLVISSVSRSDRDLLDLADTRIRSDLATVEGLASAPVFGGVFRQMQVYVDPRKLESLNLSPTEIARVLAAQSQVIPTGEARFGPQTYYVSSNSMAKTEEEFRRIPIKNVGAQVVRLGDVAEVMDGQRWRTNTVLVDGRRAVYMPLLRQAGASAVTVVDNVQKFLPELYRRGLPDDVRVEVAFDQAQYVREAIANLRLESIYGSVLASLVVLLFLGSVRSTWIVALSIPLSVMAAFLGLYFTGHTLNIMTLGGIALVLGRVIDDSIVDVENTVRHLHMGKTRLAAARDSAEEIAVPLFMATLTTIIVFLPITFMSGLGKYLFTPLAVSASFAMAASYLISRTVSPLYCSRFLKPPAEPERYSWWLTALGLLVGLVGLGIPTFAQWAPANVDLPEGVHEALSWPFLHLSPDLLYGLSVAGAVGAVLFGVGVLFWISPLFQLFFKGVAAVYERLLRVGLHLRYGLVALVLLLVVPTYWCFRHVGQELFPEVDASEFTIHLRASGGPRVEATEDQVTRIEKIVRETIPKKDVEMILSNIGINARWSAIYTSNNGPHAAFVRVQLRSGFAGRTTSTLDYVHQLRGRLARNFPGDDFFFETGGMIRRILNSGSIAPIEVQVYAHDNTQRRALARALDMRISRIPHVQETYMPQGMNLPMYRIDVDRTAARLLGFTETDAVRNVITTLMSSSQLVPNFWIDPKSGNPYLIGVQYPEYFVRDKHSLERIPVTTPHGDPTNWRARTRLDQVAHLVRTQGASEIYHYDIGRVSQIFVAVGDQELAGTSAEIERIVAEFPLKYATDQLPADKKHLAGNPRFMNQLEDYFREKKPERAQKIRADLLKEFKVDAEPLKLPSGVRFEIRGEVQSMRSSFGQMGFSLILAVVLLYLLMAAQFASWRDPLIMIVAAPLGLIGVVVTLWATGTSLNIQSVMGVLMMIGISHSNSTLLVDFANRLRQGGMDTFNAIVKAARVRLQPILMTSLATVAGLLPLAVHFHPGDEMNLPLARAVIGGLISSTLLTLFVVPALYIFLTPRGPAVPVPVQPEETPTSFRSI
jgi:HAE1 family hydrophobic/amphiphilic exporter-1